MVRKTLYFIATIASITAAATDGGFFITQDVLQRMAGAGPVSGVYTLQQASNGELLVSKDEAVSVIQNEGMIDFVTSNPSAVPMYAPSPTEIQYATQSVNWTEKVNQYESQNPSTSTFVPIVAPVGEKEGAATKPIATADAKKAVADKKSAVDTKKKGVKSGIALGALGAMAVFSMML
ncbi:hypothetical protein CWI42_011200 [Ordospora colligata]|uniref:Uncharacterized protein n=1 Tax=Ordospora colligata OC4 TaxID=1354746 RepID=A0A0B2UHB6_9MICR|nr:uncharacterized protein M896_011200 [Ordospora colligata OC4]KHN70466.1 hypothetical protein M896_011200 [Ordospora colligata OC4]TBU17216.1 hypothetical protein CWI41_011200 [Ordospora colligata]TBU17466.1 hypothetical protein CWI40_011200 [Ordospora colligata]TBU19646.1 hypothetical protein CWI42_011200 [Ordospora colligata]